MFGRNFCQMGFLALALSLVAACGKQNESTPSGNTLDIQEVRSNILPGYWESSCQAFETIFAKTEIDFSPTHVFQVVVLQYSDSNCEDLIESESYRYSYSLYTRNVEDPDTEGLPSSLWMVITDDEENGEQYLLEVSQSKTEIALYELVDGEFVVANEFTKIGSL